jgi:hypothetical protein
MKTRTLQAFGLILWLGGGVSASAGAPARRCPVDPAPTAEALQSRAPVVQLAILLDTSNSMDGLIDQARSQLWKIVNELANGRRHGRAVELQVALYEYGNNRIAASQGYVRRVLPFTTDLDRVSEELFALRTNGGDEYCGTVIQTALDELRWSSSPADLKVVFIAGNEPFTQGPVSFRKACARARSRGIAINTIHCGPRDEGERTGWKDGALLADGSYSIIDQQRTVEHISAPQDAEIARLGLDLNETYIPFGAEGREGQARQSAQDKNAEKAGTGSATHRAVTKANRIYSNAVWDLVDAVKNGSLDLKLVKEGDLPSDMQGLSVEERKAMVEAKAKERERIQAQIQALDRERNQYVAQKRRSKSAATDTLDVVVTQALREQATCLGIELQ